MEACAGREQDFFQKGTQHDVDGHRGKTLIEAFMDHHMIGRAMVMDRLAPGTLEKAVAGGKVVKNADRNAKERKRRAEQKAMQADGVNLVEGRTLRVGHRNSNGKLEYTSMVLHAGDAMPAKEKRILSESDKLTKGILKKLKCNDVYV